MIKKYFYSDNFWQNIIKKKDQRIIDEYKKILKYKKIKFVYQNIPKGTGDAVLKTQNLLKINILMLLPDDLIIKKIAQMP